MHLNFSMQLIYANVTRQCTLMELMWSLSLMPQ